MTEMEQTLLIALIVFLGMCFLMMFKHWKDFQ